AAQNLAGFVFQVVLTRVVLNRFGVGVALLMLPLALCGGSLGILVNPTLWVAVGARLTEGGLRYSLHEATREILYLPLPSEVRSQARPLIDIFGARLFEGLAGLLILFCTAFLHISVGGLGLISIGMILVWTIAVLAIKREYLDALRSMFSEVPVHSHDRAAEVLDPETVGMLVANLKAHDEVQVCQTLAMLDLVHDKSDLVPHLKRLMTHSSPAVQAQTLGLLGRAGVGEFLREGEALLSHSDAATRVEAVRYLCRFGGTAERARAATFLRDQDPRIRTAAIASVAGSRDLGKGEIRAALKNLWQDQDSASGEIRAEAALVLGTLDNPDFDDFLTELLKDSSPEVARAALEGVERIGRRVFGPHVLPRLADERLVIYAQRTIKAYGDRILGTLRDYIDDPAEPVGIRRAIPGCFTAIGTPRAARVLVEMLADHQREFGDAIVEALGEMRHRRPELIFDPGVIEAALLREVEAPLQPRKRAEATERHLGRAMGLLALIYPIEDIYRAYAGLKSGKRELRANAIELLDNLIRPELKRAVLPYIEAWAPPDTGL
ncbi:MAG: MFS transporter, partial [Planctomycetota bacterium]